jgi:SAM-dependent methyltransferase
MADKINRLILIMLTSALLSPDVVRGKVDVGPYVQFTGPYTGVVRWDTDTACSSTVQYGKTRSLGLSVSDPAVTTTHEVTIDNFELRTKYYYRVNDGDGDFTERYWPQSHQGGRESGFDTAINYTRIDCRGATCPYPRDSLTTAYEAAADRILAQTGIETGYCLVYGCGEGRLAFELAKRSDMIIIGVDEDSSKIQAGREKLIGAGVYGARVTLRKVTSLSSLPFTKYFANLIVSDDLISDGDCAGTAAEMFRVLRPSGGIAYLGQPAGASGLTKGELETWLDAGSLTYRTTNDANGIWSKVSRGSLPGTGWWSHQYGTPENSGNSFDNLAGAAATGDMEVQWIGRPGSDSGVDRQPRLPAPVAKNGRLYHQGLNRIMALDSYNGFFLWSLEIPYLRRVNIPRDAGNLCADDEYLYLAVQDACWRLDGDTGLRTLTHKLNDPGHEWGCVFRDGNKLYGSAVVEGSGYKDYWTEEIGWYVGTSASRRKVCSEYIFADNAAGGREWTYDEGVIINSSIAFGGGRVYFVESRPGPGEKRAALKGQPSGQRASASYESGLWTDELHLVALDADTGTKLWEKALKTGAGGDPIIADGDVVFYLLYAESAGVEYVILESSNSDAEKFFLYSYAVTNGGCNYQWQANHSYTDGKVRMKRPIVVGDAVYLFPKAYSLAGTGDHASFRSDFPRAACGACSAAGNVLMGSFTESAGKWPWNKRIGMWDAETSTASYWSTIRPGCWISTISGGGMVLAPEQAGGCACGMWFNTSVGWIAK